MPYPFYTAADAPVIMSAPCPAHDSTVTGR